MGTIKDIVDLTVQLEGRAKERRDIDALRQIHSMTSALQSQHADIVERDIQLMQENADLKRKLAEAQAEEVRIHRAIEFRKGSRTGNKWAAFCPKCHMPALPYVDRTMIECSTMCGWMAPMGGEQLETFIAQL
jgi:regulator of replication initiation timing